MKKHRLGRSIRAGALWLCILFMITGCYSQPAAKPVNPGVDIPAFNQATPLPTVSLHLATQEPAPTEAPAPAFIDIAEPAKTDPVRDIITKLSDEELLGQMVMVGFSGSREVPEETAQFIQQYKIGNIMLFGWNVRNFEQTKALTDKIHLINPVPGVPQLIGLDVEGGQVKRMVWRPRLLSAQKLGINGPQAAYAQNLLIGKTLHDIGVNINFAPVLDIAPRPGSTYLNRRMYGNDPEKVIPVTNAVIHGLKDGGILALGKHFPGLGMTATDPHITLPTIDISKEKLESYALKPFIAACNEGIDAILVTHVLIPSLDAKNPATLSKPVITDLLRSEIGFKGLIVSDDMRMGAIIERYDIGEACIRFIEAGGDIVLIGKYYDKQKQAMEALMAAVKSGRLTRQRLEESAYRILSAKMKLS